MANALERPTKNITDGVDFLINSGVGYTNPVTAGPTLIAKGLGFGKKKKKGLPDISPTIKSLLETITKAQTGNLFKETGQRISSKTLAELGPDINLLQEILNGSSKLGKLNLPDTITRRQEAKESEQEF